MEFGEALTALFNGQRVARKGWNGKNMWLYFVRDSLVDQENLVNEASQMPIAGDSGVVVFNGHIDMKTADGSITVGWAPSQPDMQAKDWHILGLPEDLPAIDNDGQPVETNEFIITDKTTNSEVIRFLIDRTGGGPESKHNLLMLVANSRH